MRIARHEISFVPVGGMSVSCGDAIREGVDEGLAIGDAELAPDRDPTAARIALHQAQRPRVDGNRQGNMALRQQVGERLHVDKGALDAAVHAQRRIGIANVVVRNGPANAPRRGELPALECAAPDLKLELDEQAQRITDGEVLLQRAPDRAQPVINRDVSLQIVP